MTLLEGILPQKTTEWERERNPERKSEKKRKERNKERKKMERERVSKAPQVAFLSSNLPVLWICITVFGWFRPSFMDCGARCHVIAFGGAHRFTVFRALLWQESPPILKWYSAILAVTHTYIHACIHTYIHTYMHAYIHTYVYVYTYKPYTSWGIPCMDFWPIYIRGARTSQWPIPCAEDIISSVCDVTDDGERWRLAIVTPISPGFYDR